MAQARMVGEKSSEITVVREFLKDTGLEKKKLRWMRITATRKQPRKSNRQVVVTLSQLRKISRFYWPNARR